MSEFRTALMALRQIQGQMTDKLSDEDAKSRERLLHTMRDILETLGVTTEDDVNRVSEQAQGAA